VINETLDLLIWRGKMGSGKYNLRAGMYL